jgi:hypothetical protein
MTDAERLRAKAVSLYQMAQEQMQEVITKLEAPLDAALRGEKQGVVVLSLLLIAAGIMSDPLAPAKATLDPIVLEVFRMFLENRRNSIPTFVGFHPRSTPNS